ncbi:MAG: hypothetical protein QME62_02040 [Armatimonadota bacterium]|nr:hypothetical protein [Armatimonadota bacterium]
MHKVFLFEVDYSPVEPMPIEKDAKIFEAGEYPDKGISVTEEDLDTIISNFREAPVKVEHTDSPLDPLGIVKRLWRRWNELFARLAFPADVAGFLERRGVRKLSVALLKDPLRLAEVSLVLNPRVHSAAMFCYGEGVGRRRFAAEPGDLQIAIRNPQFDEEVSKDMNEDTVSRRLNEAEKEIEDLKFALKAREVESQLAELKAGGKIVPSSEQFARAILLHADQPITFSGRQTTLAELFIQFLKAQPKVIEFSEIVPATCRESSLIAPEEEKFLAKLGVTKEKLEKYAKA